MASSANADGQYSSLATPARSSLRQHGARIAPITPNSVRFSGINNDDLTDGIGPLRGRSPINVKQDIFRKYFDEFASYPLLMSNMSMKGTQGNSRAGRSVKSAQKATESGNSDIPLGDGPWAAVSTTHVPSDSDSRWASGKRTAMNDRKTNDTVYGKNALLAATRPVTAGGKLDGHLDAFDVLLKKAWSRQEIEHAEAHHFFRRLVPQLGVERLQGPAALLLSYCATQLPAVLLPLTQSLCAVLPVLLNSPRPEIRQAGCCLLGLLWRATASGPSQLQAHIVTAPKLLDSLCTQAGKGDIDALWALREVATAGDARGPIALERCGGLQAVCLVLKRAVAAAGEHDPSGVDGSDDDQQRVAGRGHPGDGGRNQRHAADAAAVGSLHIARDLFGGKGLQGSPARTTAAAAGCGGGGFNGVTEGGAMVERAAAEVLVADCLAAFTLVYSAANNMCSRHHVPERLVRLLLATPPPSTPPHDSSPTSRPECSPPSPAASGSVSGSAPAGSSPGKWSVSGQELPGADTSERREPQTASGGGGGGDVSGGSGEQQSCWQLPLQEALLHCLYCLASCGLGALPREAVRDALRDGGEPLVARLAAVLQDRQRLEGCSAAAYLLWLLASGDYSPYEGSEANVLRNRLAAAAPATEDLERGVGGGAGSSSAGYGVVPAISELLLRHLPEWKDARMDDCVVAVRSTVPQHCEGVRSVSRRGTSADGGGSAGGGRTPPADVSGGDGAARVVGRPGSGEPPTDMRTAGQEETPPRASPLQLQASAAGGGGGASGSVFLTPRERPGTPSQPLTPTPQRYSAESSDEGGSDSGRRAGGPQVGQSGEASSGVGEGGGGGDTLGSTQDLDLSNVIDSSVEVTGDEHLMRAVQAAGTLAVQNMAQQDSSGAETGAQEQQPQEEAVEAPIGGADGDGGTGTDPSGPRETQPHSPVKDAQQTSYITGTSDMTPGCGSTPYGAPPGSFSEGAQGPPEGFMTPQQTDIRAPPSPARRPTSAVMRPSVESWMHAVRHIRHQRRHRPRRECAAIPVPVPSQVQALLVNSAGLLSIVALSTGGAKAVYENAGLMSYIASLLDLPPEPQDSSAAALGGSGVDLRHQLLALLTNISTHPDGAAAMAATASGGGPSRLATAGGPASLPEILYGTAHQAVHMLVSVTSWSTGQGLLERCFVILTNLQRADSGLSLPPDPRADRIPQTHTPDTPRSPSRSSPSPTLRRTLRQPPNEEPSTQPRNSYTLAVAALCVPLPPCLDHSDRLRLRTAAARMMDSAIAAYEGVGRLVPPAAASELILLLTAGRPVPPLSGAEERAAAITSGGGNSNKADGGSGGGGGAHAATTAMEADAASAAAGALWQLLAAGMVSPDELMGALEGPLAVLLRRAARAQSDPELVRLLVGLMSCLARSEGAARRLWRSALLLELLRVHQLARRKEGGGGGREEEEEGGWAGVAGAAVAVCEQLCRVCYVPDERAKMSGGDVEGPDKRVDRWNVSERMLAQLGCRVVYDGDVEAVKLEPLEG